MNKSKVFIQYVEDSFSINVVIGIKGNVRAKNQMIYKGNNYKKTKEKINLKWNEKNKEYKNEWYFNNKDECNNRSKKWYINNKKRSNELSNQWYINNKDKVKTSYKQYYIEHKEEIKERVKQWCKNNPNKVKEHRQKINAKRRNFGFNLLNNPFKNCEGHHIDRDNIIFIPKEMHRSIWHSVIKNKNMHEINTLAINYYWKEKFMEK